MNKAMKHYRMLEAQLVHMRWVNRGHESPQEELLVEQMAEAWWDLSGKEQAQIRAEGPKSLITEPEEVDWHWYVEEDPPEGTIGTLRVFKEVA
ncbi:MAG: hypothetical protein HN396_15005 [Gemmatimonadales bacterium]|jgi:hypothetical protein|nr:hypothetical protein [Gemmatimonadales bacterium]